MDRVPPLVGGLYNVSITESVKCLKYLHHLVTPQSNICMCNLTSCAQCIARAVYCNSVLTIQLFWIALHCIYLIFIIIFLFSPSYRTSLSYSALYFTVVNCTFLYFSVIFCNVLHCHTLYCTSL